MSQSFNWRLAPLFMKSDAFLFFSLSFFPSPPPLFKAGFLVWIGGPFVEYSAIEVFKGYGGTLFVGTGALVVGYSPLAEAIAIVPPHKDYWVQGTCEPYEAAWAPGPPFFVTGGEKNCDVYEEPPEEKQKNWRQSGRDEARVMLNALFREQEDSQVRGGRRSLALGGGNRTYSDMEREISLWVRESSTREIDVSDPSVREEMQNRFQVPLALSIAAASLLETMKGKGGTGKGRKRRKKETSMYIGGPLEGECRICGVEQVEGPGAEACEVTE